MARCLLGVVGLLIGCGGGTPAASPVAPTPPVDPVRVLTTLVVHLPDSLRVGDTWTATVRGVDQFGATMTVGDPAWSSLAPELAPVTASGLVLAMATGNATVTAQVGSVTGRATVRLTPPPPGPFPVRALTTEPGATSLEVGHTVQALAVTTDFAGRLLTGRAVVWSSSAPTIATVSATGLVRAKAPGSVLIEATSEGQHGAVALEVTPEVDSAIVVTIPAPLANVTVGDTMALAVAVQSPFPVLSVVARVGSKELPLPFGPLGSPAKPWMGWGATVQLTSLAYGSWMLVVTATDSRGHMGIAALPFVRNPKLTGGSKGPSSSK